MNVLEYNNFHSVIYISVLVSVQVLSLEVSEDVNRVLFGLAPPAVSGAPNSAWKSSTALAAHLATPLRQTVLRNCSDDTAADISDMLGDLKIC